MFKVHFTYTKKAFSLVSLLLVIALSVFVAASVSGASQLRADWLWDEEIQHSKLNDEPANIEPWTYGVDCVDTYVSSGLSWCVQQTPVGRVANNVLINGPKGTHPFNTFYGFIAPSIPEKPGTILTYSSPSSMGGAQMVQYSTYKPANLKYVERFGLPPIKEYQYQPDSPTTLKYANGQTAALVARSIAFSNNGNYMVAGLYGGGVIVFNTTNWNSKVISVDTKLTGFDLDKKGANLAISDDGQFVAANINLGSPATPKASMLVYDTRTCLDQSFYLSQRTKSNSCEYHDIWNGTFRSMTFGAISAKTNVEYPRNQRFIATSGLRFDVVYGRTSATSFSVARYMASVDLVPQKEYIGLLGMGDSYISGEGAFTYRSPTDSSANKCHNSWLSYPYTKGNQHIVKPVSVACSGAVAEDVQTTDEQYKGQSRVSPQLPWEDRLSTQRDMIERTYLPGYKGQVLFAREIKPKTNLLSVGGNDIHFSDIIKGCVLNIAESTCYSSYTDRKNLMHKTTSIYDDLVKTYTDTKTASKGNVYVVGYPEIAKPGGNCGGNVRMDGKEVQFSVDLVTFLNKVIKNAASDAGVFYVDNQKALNGYRLCEAPKNTPGMHGLTKGNDSPVLTGNESYHPTAFGAKLLGDSIVAKTNNFTVPMPAKTKLGAPAILDTDPLLKGLSPTGYNYSEIIWKGGNGQPTPKIQRGKTYTLNMQSSNIKVGSQFVAELHSDPIKLYTGTYHPSSELLITIPASTPTGMHELHILGTSDQGPSIDVIEQVYVIASETDYDGDGVPNSEASCVFVPDSGIDEDIDGIDDACDTLGSEDFVPEGPISDDSTEDFTALMTGVTNIEPTNSLLTEYVEPKTEKPTNKPPIIQKEAREDSNEATSAVDPGAFTSRSNIGLATVLSALTYGENTSGSVVETGQNTISKSSVATSPQPSIKKPNTPSRLWYAVPLTLLVVCMLFAIRTIRNRA